MSHPHKKTVSNPDFGPQTKILTMLSNDTKRGLLQEARGNGPARSSAMKFTDPQAALSWCMANSAGFFFFQVVSPKGN